MQTDDQADLTAAHRPLAGCATISLFRSRINRALLGVQIGRHIPGLLDVELGMFGIDAARHVALNELGGDRDVVHARGRVEAVRAPERRKPVASVVVGRTDPRTLSILTAAGYADL